MPLSLKNKRRKKREKRRERGGGERRKKKGEKEKKKVEVDRMENRRERRSNLETSVISRKYHRKVNKLIKI